MSEVEPQFPWWKSSSKNIQTGPEVPLLSGTLDWTQTNVKHWKIRKISKEIWKIVILLGYPNKMQQYYWWITEWDNLCSRNFQTWEAYLKILICNTSKRCWLEYIIYQVYFTLHSLTLPIVKWHLVQRLCNSPKMLALITSKVVNLPNSHAGPIFLHFKFLLINERLIT